MRVLCYLFLCNLSPGGPSCSHTHCRMVRRLQHCLEGVLSMTAGPHPKSFWFTRPGYSLRICTCSSLLAFAPYPRSSVHHGSTDWQSRLSSQPDCLVSAHQAWHVRLLTVRPDPCPEFETPVRLLTVWPNPSPEFHPLLPITSTLTCKHSASSRSVSTSEKWNAYFVGLLTGLKENNFNRPSTTKWPVGIQ